MVLPKIKHAEIQHISYFFGKTTGSEKSSKMYKNFGMEYVLTKPNYTPQLAKSDPTQLPNPINDRTPITQHNYPANPTQLPNYWGFSAFYPQLMMHIPN